MSTYRVTKGEEVRVSLDVINDKSLSCAAKGVYACLCSCVDSGTTINRLCSLSSDGRSATERAIKELLAHGLVEMTHGGSGPEMEAAEILHAAGICFEREVAFTGCSDKRALRFDFYIPDLSLAIEIDGPGHFIDTYGPASDVQRRDRIKDAFCSERGIHLVRIPFHRFGGMRELITDEIRQRQAGGLGVGTADNPSGKVGVPRHA